MFEIVISVPAAILLLIILIITIKTIQFRKPEPSNTSQIPDGPDPEMLVRHLQEAIQFKTVSHPNPEATDFTEFTKFHSWLERTYPLTHKNLTCKKVGQYTLIYQWVGSNHNVKPILFTAHQDVVPAGSLDAWEHKPFDGVVADGFVWGRGTLDVKIQLISILEAIEYRLQNGDTPKQTIYLCFGHDEEIGGQEGALAAAKYFKEQGIEFSFLLDEGGAVAEHMIRGFNLPLAAVGVAEKGYIDIELTCSQRGGHSSMPPRRSALGYIAEAILRLEKHQFPLRLTPPPAEMFRRIGPHMPVIPKIIIANLWLFKPLFLKMMSKNTTANAMIRTTTAPTMALGSEAANVLPTTAKANINYRLLHGETSNDVLKHVGSVLKGLPIAYKATRIEEPSRITQCDSREFAALSHTIKHIFPETVVSPYLMVGGTDATKYQEVCSNIFRFSPYKVESSELDRIHSCNERISIENIQASTQFFIYLMHEIEQM